MMHSNIGLWECNLCATCFSSSPPPQHHSLPNITSKIQVCDLSLNWKPIYYHHCLIHTKPQTDHTSGYLPQPGRQGGEWFAGRALTPMLVGVNVSVGNALPGLCPPQGLLIHPCFVLGRGNVAGPHQSKINVIYTLTYPGYVGYGIELLILSAQSSPLASLSSVRYHVYIFNFMLHAPAGSH